MSKKKSKKSRGKPTGNKPAAPGTSPTPSPAAVPVKKPDITPIANTTKHFSYKTDPLFIEILSSPVGDDLPPKLKVRSEEQVKAELHSNLPTNPEAPEWICINFSISATSLIYVGSLSAILKTSEYPIEDELETLIQAGFDKFPVEGDGFESIEWNPVIATRLREKYGDTDPLLLNVDYYELFE